MASIGLNIDFTGTGYLIVRWRKASAPLAEVGRLDPMAFPVDTIATIPDLDSVVYAVDFYQSADGASLDSLLRTWTIDAERGGAQVSEKYYYKVGRGTSGTGWSDPAHGAAELRDTRLKGANYVVLFKGEAFRVEGVDYVDYEGGGFDLQGNVFNEGEEICVIVLNAATVSASPVTSSTYDDIVTLSADLTFTAATHDKKHLVAGGIERVLTVTIPSLATLANCRALFATDGFTSAYPQFLTLQFSGSDTVNFRGEAVSSVTIGKGEVLELKVKDNVAYIGERHTHHDKVGARSYADAVGVNQLPLDGTKYTASELPRLKDFVAGLPPAQIVTTEASWGLSVTVGGETLYPNKGKYMYDGTDLIVPDDRNRAYRALKTTDGTNDTDYYGTSGGKGGSGSGVPGSYQHDTMRDFRSGAYKELLQKNGTGTIKDWDASAGEPNLFASYSLPDYLFGSDTHGKATGQIAVVGI